MSFDALTLSAVCDELEPLLSDARMQKAVFLNELSLALEIFAPGVGRTNLLLSAHPEQARVQRIARLPARSVERETPFSLLVRKHLRDAHIRRVSQPRLERVFELDCEQRGASGQHYRVVLIVEAMGRRSNLVLVDGAGVILDAARRTPPSRNSRRPVLPHLPYVQPPPQDRLFPEVVSAETLAASAAVGEGSRLLARFLSDRLAGLSPLSGRELAYRATGAVDTPLSATNWDHVADAVHLFMSTVDTHDWLPTVAFDHDGPPLEYAPYVLTHLEASGARIARYAGISAAMDAYYAGLATAGPARRGDQLAAERRALIVPIERALETTGRRLAALEHQLDSGHSMRDPLRRAGELLLAHQAEVPPGSTELEIDGERVALDGRMSAVDNAQAYFARYRKAREAEDRVPALIEEARQRATHLADLHTLVELAEGMDSVRALRREVAAASGDKRIVEAKPARLRAATQGPSKSSGPYRRVALGNGWEALVGTSATGNATVSFDLAQAEDLWLHARGAPGAHVILRTRGSTPPESVVERAAQLAAWHSAGRAAGAVEVDVAPRRYVKKIPNAPPGLVRYANERTIRVTPTP